MLEIVSDTLWARIQELAQKATYKYAAIAYVTNESHVKFGKGDVLVVDASDHAVRAGQTSAKVLQAAHTRGAELYSLNGLHAKALALGKVAVIGSGNMSSASIGQSLVEAAVITDNPSAVAGVLALIDELKRQADTIDDAFLGRIAKLPVVKSTHKGTKKKVSIPKHRTWLVNVNDLDEDQYPKEQDDIEEGLEEAQKQVAGQNDGVSWLRVTGDSLFKREARLGDSVVQLWKPSETSPIQKVLFPAPILRRQDETLRRTRFYFKEEEGFEDRILSWAKFKKLWGKVTEKELPTKNSIRSLDEATVERLIVFWND
jgi:hypothetical protein